MAGTARSTAVQNPSRRGEVRRREARRGEARQSGGGLGSGQRHIVLFARLWPHSQERGVLGSV